MGAEVQSKGYFLGYNSMRDLNEDSNSCSWPLFQEDKTLSNGHYNGFLPSALSDDYAKDVLKEKMLEHEAIFKNQVYELHRVYRIQKGLMEEIKKKEFHDNPIPTESSFSSSPLGYQTTAEGIQKWKNHIFHLPNAVDGRSSISGACSSRNSDGLESRPPKVRRVLLDLELPASEYIDTEEREHATEDSVSGISTFLNNRNYENRDSGATLFRNSGGKADCHVGASVLLRKNGLTDLNEPVQVRSLSKVSYHKEILHMEPNSQCVECPKEAVPNSHHFNGMPNNSQLKTQEDDKGCVFRALQAGCNNDKINTDLCRDEKNPGSQAHERGHETSTAVCLDSVKASQIPTTYSGGLVNLSHPGYGVSSCERQKGSLSQNMKTHMHPFFNNSSFSMSSRPSWQSQAIFSNGWHTNRSNQYLEGDLLKQNGVYLGSSSESKELLVNVSSPGYGYPSCSIDINVTPDHMPNPGYAKNYNGLHVMKPKFEKDLNLNAVPPNSSSIKQYSGKTVEVIDLECKNDGILPWLRPKSACNGIHVMKPKFEKDFDLNAVPPNILSNEQFSGKTVEVIDLESKNDEILPRLRPKSACNKEDTDACGDSKSEKLSFLCSPNQALLKKDSEKISSSHYASNLRSSSCFSKNEAKSTKIRDSPYILGVPIFEKPCSLKSESKFVLPASTSSLSSEYGVLENKRINIVDINLPYDPDADLGKQITCETQAVEKGKDTNGSDFRHQIDLNSFANEDANFVVLHVPTTTKKVVVDIDLEAPYIPESEDDVTIEGPVTTPKETEQNDNSFLDEYVKVAAEAIISISSSDLQSDIDYITDKPPEASKRDELNWFAEIVFSIGYTTIKDGTVLRRKSGDGNENTSQEEIDYFELMTLNLTECREEEYMPLPLVPENIKVEETGTSLLTNRPRRGLARRGRRRRDFQRDILPGLASLSRHEITEDVQTFAGLMRATGHSWNSRLGRRTSGRNGRGRGRRRSLVSSPPTVSTSAVGTPLIQQLNNVDVGLEDRNLRGWEKTTRRPRRQRFPTGNLPTLPVT